MRLKKFFAPPSENTASDTDTKSELNFKSEPKITGPVARAMKKLLTLQKEKAC